MTSPFHPHVDVGGAGETIVMVHGSWTDGATWHTVADDLRRDHRVVTYDRRGHSRSAWDAPVTRRQDEDDLIDVIESLADGPVHVVANSYGAAIPTELASLIRVAIAASENDGANRVAQLV